MWKEKHIFERRASRSVSSARSGARRSICAETASRRPPRAVCLRSLMELFLQNPKHKPGSSGNPPERARLLRRGSSEQINIHSFVARCLFGPDGGERSIKGLNPQQPTFQQSWKWFGHTHADDRAPDGDLVPVWTDGGRPCWTTDATFLIALIFFVLFFLACGRQTSNTATLIFLD